MSTVNTQVVYFRYQKLSHTTSLSYDLHDEDSIPVIDFFLLPLQLERLFGPINPPPSSIQCVPASFCLG